MAGLQALLSVFDITEDAAGTGRDQALVTDVYFSLGADLGLDWLRDRILDLPRADRWQALARAALRDDLYRLHRALTREVLLAARASERAEAAIAHWRERNQIIIDRAPACWPRSKPRAATTQRRCPVVLRELGNLVSAGALSPPQVS